MKIIRKGTQFSFADVTNVFEELFFEDPPVKMKRYQGLVIVTDLRNAMRTGKVCPRYVFAGSLGQSEMEWLSARSFDWKRILSELEALPWGDGELALDGIGVRRDEVKAIRIYSPFALEALKPLAEAPKKWTLKHVLQALVNGQFRDLKCEGRYTDDYAHDAAHSFRKGEIRSAEAFAKRIMEDPSGWWVSADGDKITICCHSFDNNSFIFVLKRIK